MSPPTTIDPGCRQEHLRKIGIFFMTASHLHFLTQGYSVILGGDLAPIMSTHVFYREMQHDEIVRRITVRTCVRKMLCGSLAARKVHCCDCFLDYVHDKCRTL